MNFTLEVRTETAGNLKTTSRDFRDLKTASDFLGDVIKAGRDEPFTISADEGPDFSSHYGDITSISFNLQL